MNTYVTRNRFGCRWCGCVLFDFVALSVAMPEPRRVLLINSYGREFAPFDAFAGNFRVERIRQSSEPVDFYEASLASAHPRAAESEALRFSTALQTHCCPMRIESNPHVVSPGKGAKQ